jgi:hypothetical protein
MGHFLLVVTAGRCRKKACVMSTTIFCDASFKLSVAPRQIAPASLQERSARTRRHHLALLLFFLGAKFTAGDDCP